MSKGENMVERVVLDAASFLDHVARSFRVHAKHAEYPDEMVAYEGSANAADQHAAALRTILSQPNDEGERK